MHDANYFRQKAQRCRELLKITVRPEIREQLRLWAEEFETQAIGKISFLANSDCNQAGSVIHT
jgi:hypothetical protein